MVTKRTKNLKIVTYRERVNEDIRQKSVIATRKVGASAGESRDRRRGHL